MRKPIAPRDLNKDDAAKNAQEGVITVSDLSLLTGIAASRLTKFAKLGLLEHYGEYHGKRFFNFQKIANWAIGSGNDDEAKQTIRKGMETELLSHNCPYSIQMIHTNNNEEVQVKVSWKVAPAA